MWFLFVCWKVLWRSIFNGTNGSVTYRYWLKRYWECKKPFHHCFSEGNRAIFSTTEKDWHLLDQQFCVITVDESLAVELDQTKVCICKAQIKCSNMCLTFNHILCLFDLWGTQPGTYKSWERKINSTKVTNLTFTLAQFFHDTLHSLYLYYAWFQGI